MVQSTCGRIARSVQLLAARKELDFRKEQIFVILVLHSCGIHDKLSPLHIVYAEFFPRGKVDGM